MLRFRYYNPKIGRNPHQNLTTTIRNANLKTTHMLHIQIKTIRNPTDFPMNPTKKIARKKKTTMTRETNRAEWVQSGLTDEEQDGRNKKNAHEKGGKKNN